MAKAQARQLDPSPPAAAPPVSRAAEYGPASAPGTIAAQGVWHWQADAPPTHDQDQIAVEEPLEIRVRGQAFSVTMRSPGHDRELAAGFLFSEGVVRTREDIERIAVCREAWDGNVINVFLAPHVTFDPGQRQRHVLGSSSCGLCGLTLIESVQRDMPPLTVGRRVDPAMLLNLEAQLVAAQAGFARTGGMHAAALFDGSGSLVVLREDVGRHNAVDKVLGYALLEGCLPLEDHVLLVSSRASFEIMQKALAARVPLVAALSAPTSLAVEFAQQSGQTLVAFLRQRRFNVYAGIERLNSPSGGRCDE